MKNYTFYGRALTNSQEEIEQILLTNRYSWGYFEYTHDENGNPAYYLSSTTGTEPTGSGFCKGRIMEIRKQETE